MKILKYSICIVVICITSVICAVSAGAFGITYHTQEEIRQKYDSLDIGSNGSAEYKKDYSLSSPYQVGELSDKTNTQSLNMLNFIRYVAGLPDNVTINSTYKHYAQSAAFLNALNGGLSHFPSRPSGLSDSIYKDGYFGSGKSNLGAGYSSVSDSLKSYMNDSDSSNIDRVGHRRWLLYPGMSEVGFGMAGRYTATYVIGDDFWSPSGFDGGYVCWPPKNMPYELYTTGNRPYAFSVNLGSKYSTPQLSSVKVEVRSEKLGKSWTLDSSSKDKSGEYLNVENSNYGMSKCIIFNTAHFPEDDKVDVKISGINYSDGTAAVIEYDVNFFRINEYPVSVEKCDIEKVSDKVYKGKSVTPSVKVKYKGKTLDENWDYTVSYKNNHSIGKAQIIIKGIGDYKDSRTINFNIVPNKTTLSLKTSNGKYTLSWKKISGIDKYQIYYSTDGSKYKKLGEISGSKTSSAVNLKTGKKYYFKIRSYKTSDGKKYYSAWSNIIKI